MAAFTNWETQLLRALTAPTNPANLRFLQAWQQAEGGTAAFNPLNTTQGYTGATPYNTLRGGGHVWNYPSAAAGLAATKQTLLNGYYDAIVRMLRSGTATPQQLATGVSKSPWGTGGGVLRVLGSQPASYSPSGGGGWDSALGLSGGAAPVRTLTSTRSGGGWDAALRIPARISSTARGWDAALGLGGSDYTSGHPFSKSGISFGTMPVLGALPSDVGGEHETSGLAGYPALDIFAKPGTEVVAPEAGTISRFSGHDPALGAVEGAGGPLGWSIYLTGADGRKYYLTHLGTRLGRVGETVRAGQPLGTVANYDKYGRRSHLHIGMSV